MKTLTPTTEITLALVRSLVTYDPDTGTFTHAKGRRAGKIAGSIQSNRNRISIKGKMYKAARLAVFWMTSAWPKLEVDHRNRNSLDDSWDNLRDVTHQVNMLNRGSWKRADRSNTEHPRDAQGHFLSYDNRTRVGGVELHHPSVG